jgi:hypothetical protein
VWACAGQRHFVPRTYPGHTKSPLSTQQRSQCGCCWSGEKEFPLTADRLKTRRCIAVSPNRRAAQRPAPSKPVSHPVTHHLLARCQAWGLHHPIHAAAALLGEDNLPLSVNQAFHPYHTTLYKVTRRIHTGGKNQARLNRALGCQALTAIGTGIHSLLSGKKTHPFIMGAWKECPPTALVASTTLRGKPENFTTSKQR